MAIERYLLEDGSGYYQREESTSLYLLESSDQPPDPVTFNNYLFVKVGDGMSMGDKIRLVLALLGGTWLLLA